MENKAPLEFGQLDSTKVTKEDYSALSKTQEHSAYSVLHRVISTIF